MDTDSEDFGITAKRIADLVVDGIRNRNPYEDKLHLEADCVYLKSADGRVVFGNTIYQNTFTAGMSPSGRFSVSFLPKTILVVSQHSDQIILGGCSSMLFDHVGQDAVGRTLQFTTFKRSLIGTGNPQLAILGITRIVSEISDESMNHAAQLAEKWNLFNSLSDQDRNIAIRIARGANAQMIASELHLSRKTIETHRTSVLDALGVETPVDLIKLLVRLQDNGFGDLGV